MGNTQKKGVRLNDSKELFEEQSCGSNRLRSISCDTGAKTKHSIPFISGLRKDSNLNADTKYTGGVFDEKDEKEENSVWRPKLSAASADRPPTPTEVDGTSTLLFDD
eukprot:TRINITY_DN1041_c0_g1_i4.p1 TRINITY_DN1041_c0_g1~~TRINITY_DN1041_c0_g1_i4.p1  ORF type:complete len:107 (-),score=23.46 TRINITY_DN1041_c0_g1_i4:85-405(-)